MALVLLPALAAADQSIPAQPSGVLTPQRFGRIHTKIHDRILQRQVVRAPSRSTVNALVRAPGNSAAQQKGTAALQRLEQLASSGKAKRGVRRGYGASDVEFKARGLAKTMGLSRGSSIQWNTRKEQKTIKVESSGRVVLTSRPHDRYMTLLHRAVDGIVARIAQNPDTPLTAKEQRRLAMAPTDMRAEALQKAGHKLKREQRGQELKYKMEFKGDRGQKIFTRVMGPSVSTYLPGGHHSQYIHDGKVFDTYFGEMKSLYTTDRIVYPVMLSLKESKRMDRLAQAITGRGTTDGYMAYSYGASGKVQGRTYAHGRPKGYWPPRPGDTATGNSCTTTHHRAPIGSRTEAYAWLDKLDRSGLVQGSLLQHISASPNRLAAIDGLMGQARGQTRQQLTQLKGIVTQYNGLGLTKFPLDLLGRKQLKSLLGTPFDPNAKGTTDPVGPGMARSLYSASSERVPLVVKLKRQ